jgi:hypothetical protein
MEFLGEAPVMSWAFSICTPASRISGRILIWVGAGKSIVARNRAYSNGFSGGPAPLSGA